MNKKTWIVLALISMTGLACRLSGPPMLQMTRSEYNQAIQLSNEEQLLLNLVRLKYRESPLFLDVQSVSAQFVIARSGGVAGRYSSDQTTDANLLNLDTRMSFEERPTITFLPLQGEEYSQRLMTPLSLDTIMLLYYSGWAVDRILRLTVTKINNVENAPRAAGPTPKDVPEYQEFLKLSKALRDLQVKGELDLGYETREGESISSIQTNRLSLSDVVDAQEKGYIFQPETEEETFSVAKTERVPVLRIMPSKELLDEYRGRYARILNVTPGLWQYDLKEAFSVRSEKDDDFQYDELAIGMRSLIGVLFYLSQGVEVPSEHIDRGLVTVTSDEQGNIFDWTELTKGLFQVHYAAERPKNVTLAVPFRNYWFYVAEDDLTSKSTMVLLLQLFAVQTGGSDVQAPVLTLPLGGG